MTVRLDSTLVHQELEKLNKNSSSPWCLERERLHKEFQFRDFASAFEFMKRVASAAETANHHPEWCNTYNKITIDLTTHSAGGITALDFALAQEIERLITDLTGA